MQIHDQDQFGAEGTLPPVPLEALTLPRARIIRQVRAVYADVECETPELERILGAQLSAPRAVAELAYGIIGRETQEVFLSFLLNGKQRLIGFAEVSRGTLTASLVHPREVFAPAFTERAAALIVTHNHPSGDPEPSAEDIEVTKRLKDAGQILGIPLLDHVVVGSAARFVSLRERLRL